MDINVEKFQKDLKRFCKSHHNCTDCSLNELTYGCCSIDHLTEIIPVVQKWAEEHPAKTYRMDFKEKFPSSPIDDVASHFCVKNYYGKNAAICSGCSYKDCVDCWNGEME